MDRKSILLVDDHVDSLELLAFMLNEAYNVLAYAAAEEAVRGVEKFKPDLLVLDARMYPMDGVQCLKAIRARPKYTAIPAIALTALARDVDKAALLSAGFQDVVTKPILDAARLRRIIDGLLESFSSIQDPTSLHQKIPAA